MEKARQQLFGTRDHEGYVGRDEHMVKKTADDSIPDTHFH